MRTSNRLALATGLVALLSGYGCSSDPEGGGDGTGNVPGFGQSVGGNSGNVPGGGGAAGNVPGGGGQGQVPGAGGEGQAGNLGVSQGGSGLGNAGAAGAPVMDTPPTETPGGYFASGSWRGYAWTGADSVGLANVAPPNFEGLPAEDPFCFAGTITGDPPTGPGTGYRGVALLGFNINQDLFGPTEGVDAPINEVVPTQAGVAVNFTKNPTPGGSTPAPLLRIQLQNNAGQLWCADLNSPTGADFVLYQADPARPTVPFFRTNCWEAVGTATSRPYAREPISAVVLTVPGSGSTAQNYAYDICVAGFADGNSVADAPTSISLGAGVLTGVITNAAGKQKVVAEGEQYMINNNAWGINSNDGTQAIRYINNSFEILQQVAGPGGDGSPATFPSIYIGRNGAQSGVNGGVTTDTDNLPRRITDINSIPTTFNISGNMGDNNAAYDVWFAATAPTGEYDTAQSAFLMVWTHKPNQRNPIGNNNQAFQTGQTVAGVPGTWDLWVGRRGGGGPDANNPVINYVAPATIRNFTADLNLFIQDAVARSSSGRLNGFQFSDQLFLTDVFAGFEVWSGGAGLRVDRFTAVVQ